MSNETIKEILDLEWGMFVRVQNVGGPAACQSDPKTFYAQRGSQFAAWDEATRQSYLSDLKNPGGRNLLTDKYAYMMADTAPEEFAVLQKNLPPIDGEKQQLIDAIAALQMRWAEQTQLLYPALSANGRPRQSTEALQGDTSYETYLRGELATYSSVTLRLYYAYLQGLAQRGENFDLLVLSHIVKAYGYATLQDAEDTLQKQRIAGFGL